MLRFRNFRPPLPFTCTYVFSLDPLCPEYQRADIIFKRRHDRDIFCELLSIKEPQTVLQNKETIYKSIGKCRIKIPKGALGSSLHFWDVQGRWEWIILAIWIAHFILFLSWKKPAKKIYGVCTLTAEPSPLPIWASTLLAGLLLSHSPSVCTLWMTPCNFLMNIFSRSYFCISSSIYIAIIFIAKINLRMGTSIPSKAIKFFWIIISIIKLDCWILVDVLM